MTAAAHAGLRGRRAVVLGLGRFGGGVGAARYLAGLGCEVVVTDAAPAEALAESVARLADVPVRLALGGHREADLDAAELVVANPAVPPTSPWLARARAAGARVTSEIELLLEAVPSRVVAVTGTQGKSSTARLAADLLAAAGRRVHAGGNLGGSLLGALDGMRPDDVCVLELSSYQLEALADPAALPARVVAVAVTNVLADHLERHGTREAYAAAKRRVLELVAEGGEAFLPGDDPELAGWRPPRGRRVAFRDADAGPGPRSGLWVEDGAFVRDGVPLARVADLRLPGPFQRTNALVALGLAHAAGAAPAELAAALPTARGLPHRLEDLGRRGGRRVVDNGVSTTPDSTIAALRAVPPGSTWLCGGRAKALPYDALAREAAARGVRAVAFGEAAAALAEALAAAGAEAEAVPTVEAAVAAAYERSSPGDVLLFSPACSSFDAHPNFEARARAFRAALPPPDADEPDADEPEPPAR